jgi:hypothetical protein
MKRDNFSWTDVQTASSPRLKTDDIPPNGVKVTIDSIWLENTALPGAPRRDKVVCKFIELQKPLVLNATNTDALQDLTGATTPADTVGRQLELWVDPTVTFDGKVTGGIRFRKAT